MRDSCPGDGSRILGDDSPHVPGIGRTAGSEEGDEEKARALTGGGRHGRLGTEVRGAGKGANFTLAKAKSALRSQMHPMR
jgi:hypothetical protein